MTGKLSRRIRSTAALIGWPVLFAALSLFLVSEDALAQASQNFDHFNTFTAYSLGQVLDYTGFRPTAVFGLHLYVFYRNPMNYVAWAVSATMSLIFRAFFIIYGKENRIFTKKIAAVAIRD